MEAGAFNGPRRSAVRGDAAELTQDAGGDEAIEKWADDGTLGNVINYGHGKLLFGDMNKVRERVVAGGDVEWGQKFFYEAGFQEQGFQFRTDLDMIDGGNLGDQKGSFGPEANGKGKIRPDPALEIIGLTHVEDIWGGVFEDVDSRRGRQ